MSAPENSQVRQRLIEARTSRGLSQQEVADTIGTTHVNISRWERGITRPGPYFRQKLCVLYKLSEADLDLLGTHPSGPLPTPPATPNKSEDTDKERPAGATDTQASRDPALYDPAIPLRSAIPLVGRESDLASLRQQLRGSLDSSRHDPSAPTVTLTALNGLPGVGKTALSIALAHDEQIRQHFRDGVLWAGLGPDPNRSGLLSRWGTLLGISATQMANLSGTEAWAKALRAAIGTRAMLLVIDDAWTVEDALAFKVGGPNCAHLVTTRYPSIAAHISIGGATMIRELGEEESMALLRLLAPQVVDLEKQKAHDLVQAVGGLPLALTLMGNYLRQQAYTGQARRIQAALQRLSDAEQRLHISEQRPLVESHPSLRGETSLSLQSVIQVTDQLLDREASQALYTFAVFPPKPNSFSEEAALAVAECSTDALDQLNDSGLLESSGSGRYTLHQTIADYARNRLDAMTDDPDSTTSRIAYERLIAYVTTYVEAHKKDYELLDLESPTILAALDAAYSLQKQAELVRAVIAFAPFLILRGNYIQAEMQLQRALEAAKMTDNDYGMASVLLHLGDMAQQKKTNLKQAEIYLQQGLAIARQIGDKERISALLTILGTTDWKRGAFAQAEAYLQEGLLLARQIENREQMCAILKILGPVSGNRGNFSQAEIYLQEGLILARQIDDREQMCVLLMNLGVTAAEQGNYNQAIVYYQEGLTVARQIGDRERSSALLANLGEAASELGHYTQAEAYFQEGLTLARQIEHQEWTSMLLISLAESLIHQKHFNQAKSYLQEGLSIARPLGRAQITAFALYLYGNLNLHLCQIEEAEATFREMCEIAPQGAQGLQAQAQYGLARVAAAQDNRGEALRLGRASVTALEKTGHRIALEARAWLDSIMEKEGQNGMV